MKLIMTLLVRDEEDIVAANLDFHFAQGVDFAIVTDNCSVDGTRSILERYERAGRIRLIDEPRDDYSQGRWVTRMARLAADEHGADWVINNDADEFWCPSAGSLRTCLASVPDHVGVVMAQRSNFVPRPDDGRPFYERMVLRERESTNPLGQPLPPKACHRAAADVVVSQGNHSAQGGGLDAVLADGRIEILHFPLRTYRQFENKIVVGGAAYARNTELPPSVGHARRALYELWRQGGLPDYYEQILQDDDGSVSARIAGGELVMDTRVRDQCRAPSRRRQRSTSGEARDHEGAHVHVSSSTP